MIIGYIMGIPIDDLVYRIPKEQKNKDSQLEIDFEKANVEIEQDKILNTMTKKELIEKYKYLQKINIEINEERKDIATECKRFKIEADKKINELIEYIKEQKLEIEKCNESRKCEITIKEDLRNKLYKSENEINKLIVEKNNLLIKLNKANDYIEYSNNIISAQKSNIISLNNTVSEKNNIIDILNHKLNAVIDFFI